MTTTSQTSGPMTSERLLQRFLRYVAIDTTANDETSDYPSSPGQWVLGSLLMEELKSMGWTDVSQDTHGLVVATLESNVAGPAPTVVFNSHLDTSPEMPGRDVRPQVIRNYAGGDIQLPNGTAVIRVADNEELTELLGCTLITTDGNTLLGGDDKAGLAILMELAERLREQPVPHGRIRLLFTCDEEIGRGVQHVDLERLEGQVCYTIDGPSAGQVDVETFSADLVTMVFRGVNIHPSIAKGRMVNALKAAGSFLDRLPRQELSPETTSDREGFLHPYSLSGGVAEATLKVLLRDFDTPQLRVHEGRLRVLADEVIGQFPGLAIDVHVTAQYRNLGDGLAKEPRAVQFAEQAYERLQLPCQRSIIRGGTDGSRLTELGLPTPNLSSGQHNPHSNLEWACLDEMEQTVQVLRELIQLWAASG